MHGGKGALLQKGQGLGKLLPGLAGEAGDEEEEKGGLWQGHAPSYALVRAQGENLHNQLLSAKITGVEGSALTGTVFKIVPK